MMEIDSPIRRAEPDAPTGPPLLSREAVRRVFVGQDGLRSGWRLLLFAGLWLLLKYRFVFQVRRLLVLFVLPAETRQLMLAGTAGEDTAWSAMLDFVDFGALMAAFWVMAKVERTRLAAYGLPLDRAAARRLLEGAFLGFGGMALVLVGMAALGGFEFGPVLMPASEAVTSGLLWGLALLAVALFEESLFRGYMLRSLAAAIRFCPAAVILSALFAAAHVGNPGEDPIGLGAIFAFGLVFCLIVRRTGSLWMAIGFHLGWDWAESFLFGVPDSGVVSRGRLLAPAIHGPAWLTGGTAGPEGSVLTAVVLLMVVLLVNLMTPGVDPAVAPDRR
jgi:membrane protease YdiL (CAAX protease family)